MMQHHNLCRHKAIRVTANCHQLCDWQCPVDVRWCLNRVCWLGESGKQVEHHQERLRVISRVRLNIMIIATRGHFMVKMSWLRLETALDPLLVLDMLQLLRLDYDIGWKPFTNAE